MLLLLFILISYAPLRETLCKTGVYFKSLRTKKQYKMVKKITFRFKTKKRNLRKVFSQIQKLIILFHSLEK